MTIEIHSAELRAAIQRRMATGEYQSLEDLLMESIEPAATAQKRPGSGLATYEHIFAKARGLGEDLDLRREPSYGRPVDLG